MTTCAKCAVPLSGAYCAGEMPWTCDNADACALRAELRDVKAERDAERLRAEANYANVLAMKAERDAAIAVINTPADERLRDAEAHRLQLMRRIEIGNEVGLEEAEKYEAKLRDVRAAVLAVVARIATCGCPSCDAQVRALREACGEKP